MSQGIWTTINPNVTSGTTLTTILKAFKDAYVSGFTGTSRPPNLAINGWWIDTTNAATPNFYYSFKVYTGTTDLEIFRINISSNVGGATVADSEFDITRISADTTAAILGLFKQRSANNGQVLDGDTIAEIQFIGRTATATDPIVANIKWTSSDDETSTVFGGFLSLYSVPDAGNTITEYIRLASGIVETKTPHKVNSLRLVGQNVATTATITQLSATKVLVEFTGSTATALQGINSGQATQEINLHNRSSATVTLNNQNAGAAAADRLKLPNSTDISLIADSSITLYYCTTDTRWKVKATAHAVMGKTTRPFRGYITDWTCPSNVTQVLITPFRRRQLMSPGHATAIDVWGNAYMWGVNTNGGMGDGTLVSKSSPVAIIGGISFVKFALGHPAIAGATTDNSLGFTKDGTAYAWGINTSGQLGVGDVVIRSSPVAVLGGKKFLHGWQGGGLLMMATATDGTGSYAWGKTPLGTIAGGVGFFSSPVAIIGGKSFEQFMHTQASGNGDAVGGLDSNGDIYIWGGGSGASLIKGGGGNGTAAIAQSSPIAVIGGFTWKKAWLAVGNLSVWGMGLTKDGALYSWGDNASGELGVGDRTARSSPVAVLAGTTILDAFVGGWSGTNTRGFDFALALAEDGTAYTWGTNIDGQLGVGDVTGRSSPVAVLGGLKFREILPFGNPAASVGGGFLGITLDGTMYAWGNNSSGMLGVGDVVSRSSPVAVLGGIKFSHFGCGEGGPHSSGATVVAYAQDGVTYTWGNGSLINDVVSHSSPVAIIGGVSPDMRLANEAIAIQVTPGNTYRIKCPNGRQAMFGGTPIGFDIERFNIEYDVRGN